jgi:hypothetical protein
MCLRLTMNVGRGIYVVEMFEWDEHLLRNSTWGATARSKCTRTTGTSGRPSWMHG